MDGTLTTPAPRQFAILIFATSMYVIPTTVKRARVLTSVRVGRRDLALVIVRGAKIEDRRTTTVRFRRLGNCVQLRVFARNLNASAPMPSPPDRLSVSGVAPVLCRVQSWNSDTRCNAHARRQWRSARL